MSAFFHGIGYYTTNPDAIIYVVATSLLYPTLFTEVAALVWTVFEFGRFTVEVLTWRRRPKPGVLEEAAREARESLAAFKPLEAAEKLTKLDHGLVVRRFVRSLDGSSLARTRMLKSLADLELWAAKRLERTRLFIRIGPMLGLMGTLIPISPALVALAKGDVQTLSDNLVIAFSTTVVGLFIGGLAYVASTVRERRYTQDISDLEYVLELMEVPK